MTWDEALQLALSHAAHDGPCKIVPYIALDGTYTPGQWYLHALYPNDVLEAKPGEYLIIHGNHPRPQ